jgi:hypothetical protein
MSKKIKIAFLLLVLTQAAHSLEEYYGKLWEVFAPAKFITSVVSSDHEKGFVIINVALFTAGMLIWLAAVRNNPSAIVAVWIVTIMEIINSVGHAVWAVMERNYVPGVATAPILFILALYLVKQLTKTNHIIVRRSG